MIDFLQWTAWPMTAPAVYGPFHLLFFILGAIVMFFLAKALQKASSLKAANCVFLLTGLVLTAGELYKQLFYYYILNNQQYNWWIFPFQLCSLPAYLCLLLPWMPVGRLRRIVATFLLDFNMMGAIATFIDPSGIMHSYWTLTLHGMLWHLILIFLGFYILFTDQADLTWHGFINTLPFFSVTCLIAEAINITVHPLGEINMFYISPYETSTQLLYKDIDRLFGRPIGICLYILSMIAGALLIHALSRKYHIKKS